MGHLGVYCAALCVCLSFSILLVWCCCFRTAGQSRQIVKAEENVFENNIEMGFKRRLESMENLCEGIKEENRDL